MDAEAPLGADPPQTEDEKKKMEDELETVVELPFSEEDLATVERVLLLMADDDQCAAETFTSHKKLRNVRKALAQVVRKRLDGNHLPNKADMSKEQRKKEEKLKRASRKQNLVEADARRIKAAELRQGRQAAMKSLCEMHGEQESALHLVPDGAILTNPDASGRPGPSAGAACLTNGKSEADTAEGAQQEVDASEADVTLRLRSCYTCKKKFYELHHFYESLCPPCASLNWAKRHQLPSLNQDVIALVTGGRVKIGFHAALKLLSAGCQVIVTSRFRHDALERFRAHPNWDSFKDRLTLVGIDFRFLHQVERLCEYVSDNFSHLDILVHNACQTIRRPQAYYQREREAEATAERCLAYSSTGTVTCLEDGKPGDKTGYVSKTGDGEAGQFNVKNTPVDGIFYDPIQNEQNSDAAGRSPKALVPKALGDQPGADGYPEPAAASGALHQQLCLTKDDSDIKLGSEELPGFTDVNGQLIDFRKRHSWVFKLQEVSTPELAETFLINSMTPFIMNGKLKAVLERSPRKRKFIINVSAMEGKFYRYKTPNHPHTNMAKAALNMMTKTAAPDYVKTGIYMNSVDTGWINDEKPVGMAFEHASNSHSQVSSHLAEAEAEKLKTNRLSWQTPIDEVDAAARILDPAFSYVEQICGDLLSSLYAARKAAANVATRDPDNTPANVDLDAMCDEETDEPPCGKFLKDYRETEW